MENENKDVKQEETQKTPQAPPEAPPKDSRQVRRAKVREAMKVAHTRNKWLKAPARNEDIEGLKRIIISLSKRLEQVAKRSDEVARETGRHFFENANAYDGLVRELEEKKITTMKDCIKQKKIVEEEQLKLLEEARKKAAEDKDKVEAKTKVAETKPGVAETKSEVVETKPESKAETKPTEPSKRQ